jgi:hypothetical protein
MNGHLLAKEENSMKVNKRFIKVLSVIVLGAFVIQIAGCGTIFYPERRGQTVHGGIDIVVAVTDSLWFIAFIIPGFIAWGIDLYTGALYMPPGQTRLTSQPNNPDMVVVKVNPKQLDQKMIEQIVSKHVGQNINLDDPNVQILRFNGTDADDFKAFLSKINKNGHMTH